MKFQIPFFSIKRQLSNIEEQIKTIFQEVLKSNQFIGGHYIKEFEKTFSEKIGCSHSIGCNSGTDAIWLALKALDIQKNSIVLTTPFSFIASASEIVAHEAHQTFIDINEKTYNLSPKKLISWLEENCEKINNQTTHKITNLKVSGIIVVDLFGQCFDYKEIKKIADEWNLWIIEDACQAIGAHVKNKNAGTLGDISCFSFYPTKNLGALGDGGALTTNNDELANKLLKLRNHGRSNHYEYESYGRNSRLDAIQAAFVTEKLKYLDQWNFRRREIAKIYNQRLSKLPFIKIPEEITGRHVYHLYCIQVQNLRNNLKEYFSENGVGTNIFYPKSLNQIPFLQTHKDLKTECPISEKLTGTILALPVWPELTNEEVDHVCSCIENFSALSISSGKSIPTTSCSVS